MRNFLIMAALAGTLTATTAEARQDRPITDNDPNAIDVAKTPVTDLNLDKTEIPPVLIAATKKPYDLASLRSCSQIGKAVEELDGILGDDIDLPQEARDRVSTGKVAKWVVSSFIPFRGLIREISGANAQERAVLAAVQAGVARRGFLKGVGAQRGCKYPASPATASIIQAKALQQHQEDARIEAAKGIKADDKSAAQNRKNETKDGVAYTSDAVVQKVP
ncbi:MAG: hypothetical protein K0R64_124 [Novosphingobium lindaniclasticum]|jgi:hypothetical protein|uniref:hypothetical protein n=1 Tax=Novosphingobium lindaniclasticum TaxID=1329895 RepID=UPI00240A6D64|nr:hypothetical protein [Novosphingobium lindaniclasticum]MDF2637140.1 hypothetical protein [Novosphingobium lindaniclasticum]